MGLPLTESQRVSLLESLGVGELPTPEAIKQELEQDWLLPSKGGRRELSDVDWAV